MSYDSKTIEELVEELNAQNPNRYSRLPGNPVKLPGTPVELPGIPIKLPGIPVELPGRPPRRPDRGPDVGDLLYNTANDEPAVSYPEYQMPKTPWNDPSVPANVLLNYKRTWSIYNAAKRMGYVLAAKHLLHYLTGSGNALQYTKEQLRHETKVLEAEMENRKRFETMTMTKKVIPEIKRKNFTVYDWWEVKKTAAPMSDWYFAFGTFMIVSYGIFKIKYSKGTCTVAGKVAHYFWDIYDWHPGLGARVGIIDVTDSEMKSLQSYCGAKKFREYGIWQQAMEGIYDIQTQEGNFYWHEISSGGWDIKDDVEYNVSESIRPPLNEMSGVKY